MRAIETIFGWMLEGMHGFSSNSVLMDVNLCCLSRCNTKFHLYILNDPNCLLWSLETAGIDAEKGENNKKNRIAV